jgi:hypothetical protein
MPLLSTPLLARACRIFLSTAYADRASIPERKRVYNEIRDEEPIENYLTPAPVASGVCQKLAEDCYTFRLGSKHYANLKLKVQCVANGGVCQCVFAVDTHDSFSKELLQPPADHPDAAAWLALQAANRALKEQIETAWDAAGILTHNGLLRDELAATAPAAAPEAVRK